MTTSPEANAAALPVAEQSLKDMGRSALRYAGDKPLPSGNTMKPLLKSAQTPQVEHKILY
jgi:hypothetical protein